MSPAVEHGLELGRAKLLGLEQDLTTSKSPPTYEAVLLPLQHIYDSFGRPWDLVNHLSSVMDAPLVRAVVEKLQPKVVALGQNISQSKPVFVALQKIRGSPDFATLSEARRRIVERELLDRRLGGVGLEGAKASEFNAMQHDLSEVSTTYQNHLLDARALWNVTISGKDRVKGIPERTLAAAAEAAARGGHAGASAEHGPWLFTLDAPMLGPILTYAEDRALREQLFRASATLASTGSNDNTKMVDSLLGLRRKQAALLGYPSYAAESFASKMASSDQVHKLLGDLQATARPAAEREDAELLQFASSKHGLSELQHWDRPLYITKLRMERYGIDSEAMRAYFAYPKVVQGMFGLCHRLFGVEFKAGGSDYKDALWHPDVQLFTAFRGETAIGHVLLDPYSRPGQKRAGAWMQSLVPRAMVGEHLQRPAAVLVMNFPPPPVGADHPSLLSLDEVSTLFHEFGHSLQHLLTVQNESAVSGINGVEWDAVEIASQFMEYWTEFDRRTLYSFAQHHETGQPLPEELYKKLQDARSFRAGSGVLAQVYLGSVDLRLHERYEEGEDTNAIEKAVAREVLVSQPLPEARPLCSFSHIFAGGYAAGYYSYQWSKVLSADAFSAFEENGGLGDEGKERRLGQKLASTLLAVGGGRAPAEVFADFRGRGPSPEALLRYSGLQAPAH